MSVTRESKLEAAVNEIISDVGRWSRSKGNTLGAGDQRYEKGRFFFYVEVKNEVYSQNHDQIAFEKSCKRKNIPYHLIKGNLQEVTHQAKLLLTKKEDEFNDLLEDLCKIPHPNKSLRKLIDELERIKLW